MSTFRAIICVISGLIYQSFLFTALGIDMDNVPVSLIVVLWFVESFATVLIVEKLGL